MRPDRGAQTISAGGALATRCLIAAAVAARDGAEQIGSAKDEVLDLVAAARAEGFIVADDGAVTVGAPSPLVSLSGGTAPRPADVLEHRGSRRRSTGLGAADADAAEDIVEALNPPHAPPAHTAPAGGVAGSAGRRRRRLVGDRPGPDRESDRRHDTASSANGSSTNSPSRSATPTVCRGPMRIAANRVNIAQAIADERGSGNPDAATRIAFYQGLLGEVDDPARSGHRVDRQILAFDPDRASLIELNGSLATAKSVAVMVPGMNTTIEGSVGEHQDGQAIRVGHARRGRHDHLSGWAVSPR